jgi:hypothetical protein
MKGIAEYLDQVKDFERLTQKEQVKLMCYFYSVTAQVEGFAPSEIKTCFSSNALRLPANINNELSKLAAEKPTVLIRNGSGYSFQRSAKKELDDVYQNAKNIVTPLFNVYLNAGGRKQVKYALNRVEIEELIAAINSGLQAVIVSAKTFQLKPFDNITIYNFSKNKVELGDVGVVKDEMHRIDGILNSGAIALFSHFGIDVTSEFIIKPPVAKAEIAQTSSNKHMRKIFISHASADKVIVGKLIDILEAAGVSSDRIFCSSYAGYGMALGENFLERLKIELNNDILVLFVLTKNFYDSPICLCEMGAAWIKTSEHIPILIPPFEFKDVRGVFPLSQGMKINDLHGLNSLKVKLEELFNIKANSNPSIWERKRESILEQLNKLIVSP